MQALAPMSPPGDTGFIFGVMHVTDLEGMILRHADSCTAQFGW